MLRIDILLESGDAPQEFFDRHISKVRHVVSRMNERIPRRPFTKHLGVLIVARITRQSEAIDPIRNAVRIDDTDRTAAQMDS